MSSSLFQYSEAVAARFPGVRAAVVSVDGIGNDAPNPDLAARYRAVQQEVAASLTETPPADRLSIKAWRATFTAFGVKPTQHRNAAEALLRRLQRHGDIPSISPAVDLGNLISVRHGLPVAVFDLDRVATPLTVRFAEGTESFLGIGAPNPEQPEAGEVIFTGTDGAVGARRWCWKQSAAGAAQAGTTRVVYIIEAVHDEAADAVGAASDELVAAAALHFPAAAINRSLISGG